MQRSYERYSSRTWPFCQSNCTLVSPGHRNYKSYLFLPNYHRKRRSFVRVDLRAAMFSFPSCIALDSSGRLFHDLSRDHAKHNVLNTSCHVIDKDVDINPVQCNRAANQYGISVFCTEFTCKIREYEFGLQNTEIELCQFCHIKYCCQNKAYLFWVANQSRFVAFYALKPSNTSLITKTFNLLSSTCSSNTFSCLTSCSCSTERIH